MRALRDVRCPHCGHQAEDVYCDNRSMPSCPDCHTQLVTSWHTHRAPGLETYLVFRPLQVQGVTLHSKAERDAFMVKANRRLGPHVGRVELAPDSPAQRRQDVDEIDHERYTTLKQHGYSLQDVTERRAEIKAKKEETHAST